MLFSIMIQMGGGWSCVFCIFADIKYDICFVFFSFQFCFCYFYLFIYFCIIYFAFIIILLLLLLLIRKFIWFNLF